MVYNALIHQVFLKVAYYLRYHLYVQGIKHKSYNLTNLHWTKIFIGQLLANPIKIIPKTLYPGNRMVFQKNFKLTKKHCKLSLEWHEYKLLCCSKLHKCAVYKIRIFTGCCRKTKLLTWTICCLTFWKIPWFLYTYFDFPVYKHTC